MATYSLVVSGPSDLSEFTLIGSTVAAALNYALDGSTPAIEYRNGSSDGGAAIVNSISAASTFDVYAKIRITAAISGRPFGVGGRLVTATGTTLTGYFWPGPRSTTTHELVKIVEGTESYVSSVASLPDVTSYFWVRVQASGDDIKTKSWTGAIGDEPATWDLEYTDTGSLGAGQVGLAAEQNNFGNYIYLSEIYIGTDGDSPPVGGGSGTTVDGTGSLHSISRQFTTQAAARLGGVLQ